MIVNKTSCMDTPVQNAVVKRKNRHMLEVARSLFVSHAGSKVLLGRCNTFSHLSHQLDALKSP